jgi:peptidylprolyl isomerase
MNALENANDTPPVPASPLPSLRRAPIMAQVPAKSTSAGVHVLTLTLLATVVIVAALACGGDEEVTPPNSTTDTPLLTPAPTVPATPPNCPAPPAETAPPVQAKSYEQRPALTIDTSHVFIAHVYTTRGHFIMELLPKLAPEHVNSFVFLARERFFDGTAFHRVVRDPTPFVVQGGDPTGTGSGGPGYTIPLEPSEEPFVRGVLGMARTPDPDSAGSQWFVTIGDALFLNDPAGPREERYTAFGKVTQGMEIVDCIEVGDAIINIAIQEL